MSHYNCQMWQQFFIKNNPLIDRRIIKTLLRAKYAYDPDIVADIRADIIERFIKKGLLDKYKRNENFNAWLGVVVVNYTNSWLKSKTTQKNPELLQNRLTISLDDPRSPDDRRTLEEILSGDINEIHDDDWTLEQANKEIEPLDDPASSGDQQTLREVLPSDIRGIHNNDHWTFEQINKEIGKLGPKYSITLKLSVLFYNDLEDQDIEQLAAINHTSVKSMKIILSKLKAALEDKYKNVILKNEYRMSILFEQIMRLSWEIRDLERDALTNAESIQKKRRECQKKQKTLKKYQDTRQVSVHPTAKQIAELVHESDQYANKVLVLLFRARKKLKKSVFL